MPNISRRRSRIVAPLTDNDYDHQISLVDHAAAEASSEGFVNDNGNNPHIDGVVGVDNQALTEPASGLAAAAPADCSGSTNGVGDGDDGDRPLFPPMQPVITGATLVAADTSLPTAATAGSGAGTKTVAVAATEALTASGAADGGKAIATEDDSRSANRASAVVSNVNAQAFPVLAPSPSSATSGRGRLGRSNGKAKQKKTKNKKKNKIQTHVHQPPPPLLLSMPSGQVSVQGGGRVEPEAAIDVLYENQRGLFLCGIALFSSAALGNLDPAPWTNLFQGPSPTDIHNAQVPDPSWEWAWPAWRVNHDACSAADSDGWEYSFMFAKCFSWHGPSWYKSCVRRRAWIRKRVRVTSTAAATEAVIAAAVAGPGPVVQDDLGGGENGVINVMDPNLLSPEYFTVRSALSVRRSSSRASSTRVRGHRTSIASTASIRSQAASGAHSRHGSTADGDGDGDGDGNGDGNEEDSETATMPAVIDNADVLMWFLRAARIDREKIEAVNNFLAHAGEDLVRLQDIMHEIMGLFVFQASRRTLLTSLTEAYEAAVLARQKATEDAEAEAGSHAAAAAHTADTADAAAKGKAPQEAPQTPATTTSNWDQRLQALGRRVGYLTAAVRHADEEVRRLEFWSDIRAVSRHGSTKSRGSGSVGRMAELSQEDLALKTSH